MKDGEKIKQLENRVSALERLANQEAMDRAEWDSLGAWEQARISSPYVQMYGGGYYNKFRKFIR